MNLIDLITHPHTGENPTKMYALRLASRYLSLVLHKKPAEIESILSNSSTLDVIWEIYQRPRVKKPQDNTLTIINTHAAIAPASITESDSPEPVAPAVSEVGQSEDGNNGSIVPNAWQSLSLSASTISVSVPESLAGRAPGFLTREEIPQIQGLSEFFAYWLKNLHITRTTQWKMHVNSIVNKWNKEYPNMPIYPYSPKKTKGESETSKNQSAGADWANHYRIFEHTQFESLFGVTLPQQIRPKRISSTPSAYTRESRRPSDPIITKPLNFPVRHGLIEGVESTPGDQTMPSIPEILPDELIHEIRAFPLEKQQRIIAIEVARVALNEFFTSVLTRYKRENTVPWQMGDFTGIPERKSGKLEIEVKENNTVALRMTECSPSEQGIWNACSVKKFQDLMKKLLEFRSYNEKGRMYEFVLEDATTIQLALPPHRDTSSIPPAPHTQQIRRDTNEGFSLERASDEFKRALDQYLVWYFRNFPEKKEGLPTELLKTGILHLSQTLKTEGGLKHWILHLRDDAKGLKEFKAILEALHDVPQIQAFLHEQGNKSGQFSLELTIGSKHPIVFGFREEPDGVLGVFRPYPEH